MKTEQIGKVNLDLTYYSGDDMYCDGAVEDDLLKIARDYAEVERDRGEEKLGNTVSFVRPAGEYRGVAADG